MLLLKRPSQIIVMYRNRHKNVKTRSVAQAAREAFNKVKYEDEALAMRWSK